VIELIQEFEVDPRELPYAAAVEVIGGVHVDGRRTRWTSMPSRSIASVVPSISTRVAPAGMVGIRNRPCERRL
jgi:hypothetical protein